MNSSNNSVKINCSIPDLVQDIRSTCNPIRKIILQRFLDIKLRQNKEIEEDISIDDLSDSRSNIRTKISNPDLKGILKSQKSSLDELEKINRINAYQTLIEENKDDGSEYENNCEQDAVHKTRGKTECKWGSVHDPKYSKYMKEDDMNNRMMERLNSEIDFRLTEGIKMQVQKPFDNNEKSDVTDTYARFESTQKHKYVPKNRNRDLDEPRNMH